MPATSLGPITMSASTDHTVSISGATAGRALFVAVAASATLVLHSSSVTAGWVEDAYVVNNVGFAVYRLPGASNPGGTVASLRVTHNGSAWLGGAAWEDTVTGSPTFAASTADAGQATVSPRTTGALTFTTQGMAYVVFATIQGATNNTSDLTAFDQGFTEIVDSGYLDSAGAGQNIRVWVAGATAKALTSTAVTGTWSDAGIYGYNPGAVLGFASAAPPPSGWSTSLSFG